MARHPSGRDQGFSARKTAFVAIIEYFQLIASPIVMSITDIKENRNEYLGQP